MKYFSIFFALLFGFGAFTGCAPRWVRTPVVDQRDITVSLEHKIVKKQVADQQFDHPFSVDQQDLRTLLSQLEYMAEPMVFGEQEQKTVFQSVELDRLVPALADALSKADPNQRVWFVSYNRGGGLLFKKRRQTTGVVFVRAGNRLNLAFKEINFEILTNEMENVPQRDEYADPLKIKSSSTPIVAPDYVAHPKTEKGNPFPMWIVVETDKVPAPSKPDPEAQTTASKPATQEKAVVESQAPVEGMPALQNADSWETRRQENTEKLEYLKELFESGLIDEQEYKAQKEKLLDQL